MDINYINKFQRSWFAIGAGAASLIVGGIQAISGSSRRKKAEKAIDKLQSPTYTPSKSIMDYYNKALERANVNPYQSAQYQYGVQQGARNTAAGINALQDRSSAVGGISRLISLQNDNAIKQGISAEQQGAQNLAQLGSAAQLKTADEQYAFNINKLMPYQKTLNKNIAKMGGAIQTENAGYGNMMSGISTIGAGLSSGSLIGNGSSTNGVSNTQLGQANISNPPMWVTNYQDPYLTQAPK